MFDRIAGIRMVNLLSISIPSSIITLTQLNRTNPLAVPSYGTIKNGEVVKIECVDWTGGQIGNNDSADDIRDVDLTKIHYLTGPFDIETAEPGDVLVVEIQDVQPMQEQPWGFTGIFSKENGGGFLDEIYPKP
jgi:formamidase